MHTPVTACDRRASEAIHGIVSISAPFSALLVCKYSMRRRRLPYTFVHALWLSHLSRRRRTSSSFRHRRVRRSERVRWQFASFLQHTTKKSSLHTNSSSVNLICEEKHLPCSKQARLLREVNSIFLQRSSATRV